MTDRDHFAAAALTGLLAQGDDGSFSEESYVRAAYRWADAMLRERERKNHDAVPAAIAPVDRLVRLGATDRESVGTDKAEPLNRDCGTGNTSARLAALDELSALDQKLELEYGLVGNPLIKAGRHTPQPQTTPGECSVRNGCASGRETVRLGSNRTRRISGGDERTNHDA